MHTLRADGSLRSVNISVAAAAVAVMPLFQKDADSLLQENHPQACLL